MRSLMQHAAGPHGGLDRRRFLAGTVAGGLLLGPVSPAFGQEAVDEVDVVVVGAGFAGLAAAVRLVAAGRSVRILEARNRVGGRVVNHPLPDGRMIEAGGQFVGPTQGRMFELARTFGVDTYPAYDTGASVTVIRGTRTVGGPPPEALRAFRDVSARLDAMATEVPVDAPWNAPRAREWDSQTFETWLAANVENADALAMFTAVADLWGAMPSDLSLLFALFYIAAAGDSQTPGSLSRLLDIRNGAQEQRFTGGSQILAQKMAASLGDRLVLSSPVREIAWHEDQAVTVVSDGATARARRVIVATPPALAATIRFTPELPTIRSQLMQRFPMGSLIKVTAIYDKPFWRDAGLSGVSMNPDLVVRSTFDNTLPDGGPGIILGFVGGSAARAWAGMDRKAQRAQALDSLATSLGEAALTPIDYFDQNWPGDPWSRGGPVAYMAPGVMLDYGPAVRDPVGAIHWAGTETAAYWNGYMEGAVQSGERAAAEVLSALET